jgi:hypothetical protein
MEFKDKTEVDRELRLVECIETYNSLPRKDKRMYKEWMFPIFLKRGFAKRY